MFSWVASFSAESAKLPTLIPKSTAKSLPKARQKPSKINEKGGASRETKKRPKRMPKWSQKGTHNFQEKSKNQPWSAQGAPRDPKDPQSRPQATPKEPKGDPRDPQRVSSLLFLGEAECLLANPCEIGLYRITVFL